MHRIETYSVSMSYNFKAGIPERVTLIVAPDMDFKVRACRTNVDAEGFIKIEEVRIGNMIVLPPIKEGIIGNPIDAVDLSDYIADYPPARTNQRLTAIVQYSGRMPLTLIKGQPFVFTFWFRGEPIPEERNL